MVDLALTLNQPWVTGSPHHPAASYAPHRVAEKEFWDLAFVHAAFEYKVGIFFLGEGIRYILAHPVSDDTSVSFLQALPFYGISQLYVAAADMEHYGLTLSDLLVKPEILHAQALSSYLFTARQVVHWTQFTGSSQVDLPASNFAKPWVKDSDGYLVDFTCWSTSLAQEIAEQENLVLDQHTWQIIESMRIFYHQYRIEPTMRAFIAFLKTTPYAELADSIVLHHKFPGGVIKQLCKIAGLPKPMRCFQE